MKRAVFLLLTSCCLSQTPTTPREMSERQAFERLSKAAVIVRVQRPDRGNLVAQGSGTVIGRRKGVLYVLTAAHVVGPAQTKILVCSVGDAGEGADVNGTLEDVDRDDDLALVVVPDVPALDREPVQIAKEEPVRFSRLYSIASPSNMPHVASTAILSRQSPAGFYVLFGFAWPGGSGSGIANVRGEVVAVLLGVGHDGEDEDVVLVPVVAYAANWARVSKFAARHGL